MAKEENESVATVYVCESVDVCGGVHFIGYSMGARARNRRERKREQYHLEEKETEALIALL